MLVPPPNFVTLGAPKAPASTGSFLDAVLLAKDLSEFLAEDSDQRRDGLFDAGIFRASLRLVIEGVDLELVRSSGIAQQVAFTFQVRQSDNSRSDIVRS